MRPQRSPVSPWLSPIIQMNPEHATPFDPISLRVRDMMTSASTASASTPQQPAGQQVHREPAKPHVLRQPSKPPAAAYAVHAPGGGAGQVVVPAHDTSEFPSLGDTSLVGRAVPAGNGLQNGTGNRPCPASSNLNPATAQAFVPVPRPPVRHAQETYKKPFLNGMIFKADDKTYGECLQRQLFGLPSNQMDRALSSISVEETALFLYNFRASISFLVHSSCHHVPSLLWRPMLFPSS